MTSDAFSQTSTSKRRVSHVAWSASRPIANVSGSLEMKSVPVNLPTPSIQAGASFTNELARASTPTRTLVRSLVLSTSTTA